MHDQRFPLPQLWPMAIRITSLEERDLTGVVMSLDAFMLSRFTTLTPLNGGMLVETKLILCKAKYMKSKLNFLYSCVSCISFSKLCERKVVPPSFRVSSFCIYLDGQEGKYFMKAETPKIGEIAKKE